MYLYNIFTILCIYVRITQYFLNANLTAFNRNNNYTLISSAEYRNYVTPPFQEKNENTNDNSIEDKNSNKDEPNHLTQKPYLTKNNTPVYQLSPHQKPHHTTAYPYSIFSHRNENSDENHFHFWSPDSINSISILNKVLTPSYTPVQPPPNSFLSRSAVKKIILKPYTNLISPEKYNTSLTSPAVIPNTKISNKSTQIPHIYKQLKENRINLSHLTQETQQTSVPQNLLNLNQNASKQPPYYQNVNVISFRKTYNKIEDKNPEIFYIQNKIHQHSHKEINNEIKMQTTTPINKKPLEYHVITNLSPCFQSNKSKTYQTFMPPIKNSYNLVNKKNDYDGETSTVKSEITSWQNSRWKLLNASSSILDDLIKKILYPLRKPQNDYVKHKHLQHFQKKRSIEKILSKFKEQNAGNKRRNAKYVPQRVIIDNKRDLRNFLNRPQARTRNISDLIQLFKK